MSSTTTSPSRTAWRPAAAACARTSADESDSGRGSLFGTALDAEGRAAAAPAARATAGTDATVVHGKCARDDFRSIVGRVREGVILTPWKKGKNGIYKNRIAPVGADAKRSVFVSAEHLTAESALCDVAIPDLVYVKVSFVTVENARRKKTAGEDVIEFSEMAVNVRVIERIQRPKMERGTIVEFFKGLAKVECDAEPGAIFYAHFNDSVALTVVSDIDKKVFFQPGRAASGPHAGKWQARYMCAADDIDAVDRILLAL